MNLGTDADWRMHGLIRLLGMSQSSGYVPKQWVCPKLSGAGTCGNVMAVFSNFA